MPRTQQQGLPLVSVTPPPVTHRIQFLVETGAEGRATALRDAIAERVVEFGLRDMVSLEFLDESAATDAVELVVYFGDVSGADQALTEAAKSARSHGTVIIPVVADGSFEEQLPEALQSVNAYRWRGADSARTLAQLTLGEIGIEERLRRIFISYTHADALIAADQVHDALQRQGFDPFLDRLRVPLGADFDEFFQEALNDFAFVLVLESPLAAEAPGLLKEVHYALSHYLGPLIVSWPNAGAIPETTGLPRFQLAGPDVRQVDGQTALAEDCLPRLLFQVERSHAAEIMRRRRALVESAAEALRSAGETFTNLPSWRLLTERSMIGFATSVPTPKDLFELDQAAREYPNVQHSSLVHATRRLSERRAELLDWVIGERPLRLVPETSVGTGL